MVKAQNRPKREDNAPILQVVSLTGNCLRALHVEKGWRAVAAQLRLAVAEPGEGEARSARPLVDLEEHLERLRAGVQALEEQLLEPKSRQQQSVLPLGGSEAGLEGQGASKRLTLLAFASQGVIVYA